MKLQNFFLLLLSIATPAWACDPCALFTASRLQGPLKNTLTLSLSEQYTSFDRNSAGPNSVRDGEFVEGFSTTQLAASYGFSDNLGFQLTLPIIVRSLESIERFRRSTEADAGLGDVSVTANYAFINRREGTWMLVAGLFGGVKLPTGDTGVLEDISDDEQAPETAEHAEQPARQPKHHQLGSISGGRALTFGTGSYDLISGLNLVGRYERYLLLAGAQYTVRTEGDFEYEFADDFLYSLVPAYYFFLRDDLSVAAGVSFTGEFKGKDQLQGAFVAASSISNFYVGPDILITIGDRVGIEFGLDFRTSSRDRAASVVPDVRFRSGISYRF